MDEKELLKIKNLSVGFSTDSEDIEVLDAVGITIQQGKTLSLVGESGCGKSVTASSIMRLLPHPYGKITNGEIIFKGKNLLDIPINTMCSLRGSDIAMIFQEPMNALNPVQIIQKQISEILELHRPDIPPSERESFIIELLRSVDMPSPERRLKNYPFQLSGGMRQRVMIAMALAGKPALLIADEPTTALDVTVQAQILFLIRNLQKKTNMGVLYITHDMGVVAEVSDYVSVMYAGQIVESAPASTIFKTPAHPYTRGLINSMPSLDSVPKTRLAYIKGNVPTPKAYPNTCRFAERCEFATDYCRNNRPLLEDFAQEHSVRCFRAKEIAPWQQ